MFELWGMVKKRLSYPTIQLHNAQNGDFIMNSTEYAIDKASVKSVKKAEKLRFKFDRDIPLYLLLLPAVTIVAIFYYIPMYGIVIAFQDYNPFKGVLHSQWVWFKHFADFLSDSNFWRVMRNTIIINLYTLVLGFPAPIILALLLNEVTSIRFKRITQTISYLPYFISWVVVAGIITSVLSPSNGLLNVVLNKLFGIEPIFFLGQPKYFRLIVVFSGIWKSVGITAVYYIATLTTINPDLYEASKIDGANRWRQLWHVTLPGLQSIITVMLLLQIGSLVTIGFEQIFLIYNPLVYDVGDVISTYAYRLGIEQSKYSLTTALSTTQSVVNFMLLFIANKVSRKLTGQGII